MELLCLIYPQTYIKTKIIHLSKGEWASRRSSTSSEKPGVARAAGTMSEGTLEILKRFLRGHEVKISEFEKFIVIFI